MQPYQFLNELKRKDVRSFICNNEGLDIHAFILSKPEFDFIPNSVIADQIIARTKAKLKLPEWYDCRQIVYPALVSLEQSSSQVAAEWKAARYSGNFCLDLTGGMGVDSYYLSSFFGEVIYVERDEGLLNTAQYNHQCLGSRNILHINEFAENFLKETHEKIDLLYVDPSRRSLQKRVIALEDYQPDIIPLLGRMLEKADKVLIKTSPLLDIRSALDRLDKVNKVIILVVQNECKELLFELGNGTDEIQAEVFHPGSDQPDFIFSFHQEKEMEIELSDPLRYLYEPNAGVLKSGGFKSVTKQFGVKKIGEHSHLYTSEVPVDFPGRRFEVKAVLPVDARELSRKLDGNNVNLSIRNFPGTVQQLKKQLKIIDGGSDYLFATTLRRGERKLILCQKIAES